MNREEFIKHIGALGLGSVFGSALLAGCSKEQIEKPSFEINFSGKVLIIGAGAAGMTAAYLLHQNNIDFQLIEAGSGYGGRVKRAPDFADFPIDLGAEWIHADPSVLSEIVSDESAEGSIDFVTYNPKDIWRWTGSKLKKENWATNFYSEHKFKQTTWYGFFEQFIVPSIQNRMSFQHPINSIDYSSDKVIATANDGSIFEGDRILVTIPIKVLQNEYINFNPALPDSKTSAINNIQMDDGFKAFIEFEERFYPDILLFGDMITALTEDSKTYYDAAFGKNSSRNILGLFTINENANRYTSLATEEEVLSTILAELDEIYDGKASQHYVKHIFQNWSNELFIGGSYSYEFDGNQEEIVQQLFEPVDKKVYFAGEALSLDNQATVHGACESAYLTLERLLKD